MRTGPPWALRRLASAPEHAYISTRDVSRLTALTAGGAIPERVLWLGGFCCLFALWLIKLLLLKPERRKEKPMKTGTTKRVKPVDALLLTVTAVGTEALSHVVVLLG
jgi:hypothetical protein